MIKVGCCINNKRVRVSWKHVPGLTKTCHTNLEQLLTWLWFYAVKYPAIWLYGMLQLLLNLFSYSYFPPFSWYSNNNNITYLTSDDTFSIVATALVRITDNLIWTSVLCACRYNNIIIYNIIMVSRWTLSKGKDIQNQSVNQMSTLWLVALSLLSDHI